MKLSRFINECMEEILEEWQTFAKTLGKEGDSMSRDELRDHAKGMLEAIALDITTSQNSDQQTLKSKGHADGAQNDTSAASIHGADRQANDFSLLQVSAEFRALRATVLRLWLPHISEMSPNTVYEMTRFNEAIDQALAESVETYTDCAANARDMFLAILGHDLRAPLSTMSAAAQLLQHPNIGPDKSPKIGERVGRAAALMSSMVDDLLGFSQTQLRGSMPIKLEPADIKKICESTIENASAAHPDHHFVLDATGDLTGSFDGVRLHQLFANLLSNAAQYGEKDQPIVVDARGEKNNITVRVTNKGPAIPEASLSAIFTPLVQLSRDDENDTRPKTSLGLGLFVAREIAVGHGGTVTVKSNKTDGTIFTVKLPREKA